MDAHTMTTRRILFIFGCLPLRMFIANLARTRIDLLPWMALGATAISIGFFTIWAFGLRKTGPEVFGARIWWNDLRPVHALLYGLFAWAAVNNPFVTHAWKFLAADVLLGAVVFATHHISP